MNKFGRLGQSNISLERCQSVIPAKARIQTSQHRTSRASVRLQTVLRFATAVGFAGRDPRLRGDDGKNLPTAKTKAPGDSMNRRGLRTKPGRRGADSLSYLQQLSSATSSTSPLSLRVRESVACNGLRRIPHRFPLLRSPVDRSDEYPGFRSTPSQQ
ncbi:hypothetical protein V22_29440 [Calycomorphotria hydatis]|uniref:Uncharacterized protein n=1 Tax=Calycomorphotria hydatis TaxID=2528027 RepID=A0A517TBD5_9PLAN|nr:hypothetical protein V22_29440 [Calycomorphotria hydatis]